MTEDYETVTVPMLVSGDEVVETREVPKDWHNHVEAARTARRCIADEYSDRDAFAGAGIESGSDDIHGYTTHRVVVYGDPPSALDDLPDEVDGVVVKVKQAPDIEPA